MIPWVTPVVGLAGVLVKSVPIWVTCPADAKACPVIVPADIFSFKEAGSELRAWSTTVVTVLATDLTRRSALVPAEVEEDEL